MLPFSDHDDACVYLTADIVSAFITRNSIPQNKLPDLIQSVHATLKSLAKGNNNEAAAPSPRPSSVAHRASITADYIVCLEDGKKFKSLRRHLNKLGITPDAYRAKWNLPPNYPMVAPNYAAKRSALAKKAGLGQKGGREPKPQLTEAT